MGSILRPLLVIALETFTLLRRDRIFWPALAAALAIALFAAVASQWAVVELSKVLYDIGFSGFQLTGGAVAMFWGVKMLGDARQDGSLELQLAAPVGRGLWLVGKYLGLVLCLAVVWLLFALIWQGTLSLLAYPLMQTLQLQVLALIGIGWLVLGALGCLFTALSRPALAIFATLAAWIAGLASALVDQATTPDTPPALRQVTAGIARYWDLQQFNLLDRLQDAASLSPEAFLPRLYYGLILIGLLVTAAAVVWRQRDALPA